MIDLGCSRYAGIRGPFRTGLIFLFHLAWKSRVRLPVLIAIGFMVLDIRMQFEINIDLGRGGRQGVHLGEAVIEEDIDSDEETLTAEVTDDSESYTTDSYSVHSNYNTDCEFDDNIGESENSISSQVVESDILNDDSENQN